MTIKMEMANQSVPRDGVVRFPKNGSEWGQKGNKEIQQGSFQRKEWFTFCSLHFYLDIPKPPLWTVFYVLYALMDKPL